MHESGYYTGRSAASSHQSGAPARQDMENPKVLAYCARLIRRFRDEHFAQLSASLAFTTLLSLVPLVTVVVIVASALPFFGTLVSHVDNFLVENLLPGKAGSVIARHTLQFAEKARKLTLVGVGALAITSLLLLSSIERAFNHLWRVRTPRPFFQRVKVYFLVLVVGPLVAGAVLMTFAYAVSLSLGLFDEPKWVRQLVIKGGASLLLCAFFSFLYCSVPNTVVRRRHAVIGGVAATLGILTLQRLFEVYLTKFALFTAIYGAFSVLPILLVWLYLCWAIVLVGALIVANFAPGRR